MMVEAERLKLLALDEEDLAVLSAYVQDAVLKVSDLVYLPKEQRFRRRHEPLHLGEGPTAARQTYERRRTALTFDRVRAVQCSQHPPRSTGRGAGAPRRQLRAGRRPGRAT